MDFFFEGIELSDLKNFGDDGVLKLYFFKFC